MSGAADQREMRYDRDKGSRNFGARSNRTPGVVDGPPRLVRTAPDPEHIVEVDGKCMVWTGAIETIAQLREKTDLAKADEYRASMDEGDEFPPVSIVRLREEGKLDRLVLGDGYTRLEAVLLRDGIDRIHARIVDGTLDDAFLLNIDENAMHGQQYRPEDRRKAAEWLIRRYYLKEQPDMSLREIARRVKASPTSVSEWHRKLTDAPAATPAQTRIVRDGQTFWMKTGDINASRPASQPAPFALGAFVSDDDGVVYKIVGISGDTLSLREIDRARRPVGDILQRPVASLRPAPAIDPQPETPAPPAASPPSRIAPIIDQPDPQSAPTVCKDKEGVPITLDARVQTRTGRSGRVIGMSGRLITVYEDGVLGTKTHYADTLTVLLSPVPEVAPPAFAVGDRVRSNNTGEVAKLSAFKDGQFTVQYANYNHKLTPELVARGYALVPPDVQPDVQQNDAISTAHAEPEQEQATSQQTPSPTPAVATFDALSVRLEKAGIDRLTTVTGPRNSRRQFIAITADQIDAATQEQLRIAAARGGTVTLTLIFDQKE